ncbi:ubiquinone/menaquinone biosynthesis methyltransferase [Beutenbergia cavernae DSM 12333]|uniref:Demethylmenaquinone methyltransferase n=1 Tax=Beutenbergia cavernae (strain ATCC BAA-8 / DSM 12333 / CCUG 43141 / JCM 11478 / NBRC 16432 / NCIMB 13614 / HKI 0122) TaxID=471853 RepID=MENG_BEUC1|nr:demethylmenaquinone methyltransferase [Beutenbergia cavernae]C5C0T0.1 RecName: Full=Demethylmenaquinone methyltransferase [Beutenbergia cavernae DSM 12333]ACQ81476.1 ubiquinone/menaquinone biosynthesis methyltransferase [Beutenbergia cavernae DSM 12333]
MPRAQLDKDPHDVAGMFDDVARRYDLTNDVLSLGMDRLWRRATLDALGARPGERVLDLAAGTGTSSADLADDGVDVVSCDFSTGMVAEGKRRRPDLAFVAGDATRLPFADGSFDAVTISFGLRNVSPAVAGLSEMLRVTRPGGRLVVAEFSTPPWAPFEALYGFYLQTFLTPLAKAVSSNPEAYDYLEESIRDWPDQLGVAALLHEAGWRGVGYRNLTGGIVALHRARKIATENTSAGRG